MTAPPVFARPAIRRSWIGRLRSRGLLWALPPLAALIFFVWALAVSGPPAPVHPRFVVSQRGREFNPDTLTVHVGDDVRIVNDDGDLTHHAYIQSPDFNFDSGDQRPGHDVNILFAIPGTFNVLCGIHPKMRLTVTVEK